MYFFHHMLAVAFVDLPTNHLVSPATNLHFSLQSGPDKCFITGQLRLSSVLTDFFLYSFVSPKGLHSSFRTMRD